MLVEQFTVDSPNVVYEADRIVSNYEYQHSEVQRSEDGKWTLKPQATKFTFSTDTRVPKLG